MWPVIREGAVLPSHEALLFFEHSLALLLPLLAREEHQYRLGVPAVFLNGIAEQEGVEDE